MKKIVFILLLFSFVFIACSSDSEPTGELRGKYSDASGEFFVGDVLVGIGMEEIESSFNSLKDEKSSHQANQYLESLKGEQVVWVTRVSDVDEGIFYGKTYLSLIMDSYERGFFQKFLFVTVWTENEDYLSLEKGKIVVIEGIIDSVSVETFDITVYLEPTKIKPLD